MDKIVQITNGMMRQVTNGVIDRNALDFQFAGGDVLPLSSPDLLFSYNPDANNISIRLYIHTLQFLEPLFREYRESKKKSMLELIESICLAYIRANGEDICEIGNSSDHALAASTIHLIEACMVLRGRESVGRIRNMLIKRQAAFGSMDYYQAGNHGVMMDNSAIHLAVFLDNAVSEILIETAANRFADQFREAYDDDGMCNENTPGYHLINNHMYERTLLLMDYYGIGGNRVDSIHEKMPKCYESFRKSLLPNGRIPPIGHGNEEEPFGSSEICPYPLLPILGQHFFEQSGFFFDKYIDSDNNKVYFSYINGYRSWIHKQIDEQSVILWVNGEYLIADSGFYSYDVNEKTIAINLETGHSGIFPLDGPWNITKYQDTEAQFSIGGYEERPAGFLLVGKTSFGNSGSIHRRIERANNRIIVSDSWDGIGAGVCVRFVLAPKSSCIISELPEGIGIEIKSNNAWANIFIAGAAKFESEAQDSAIRVAVKKSFYSPKVFEVADNKVIEVSCENPSGEIVSRIDFGGVDAKS